MQLKNKTAIIYGAGGSIGEAVARAFAAAGAKVYVTGKNKKTIEALANSITAAGGLATPQVVDALDEQAVNDHVDAVIKKEGKIDISFNAMGIPQTGVQGIPLMQLTPEAYLHPVVSYTKSHFITATAAARQMVTHNSGVILTLTSTPARLPVPLMGGMASSWASIEAFTRILAAETGPQGVRIVCLRADAMPETDTITEVFGLHAKGAGMPSHTDFQQVIENITLLKRLPKLAEVADTAVFLASDGASGITGTTINITCGSVID